MLENSPQRVLVRYYNNLLIVLDPSYYLIIPEGHNSFFHVRHGFCSRQNLFWYAFVFDIVRWVTIIALGESGTSLIVAHSPVLEVILGDSLEGGLLLEALERTVMLLVEPPVFVVRDPVAI